MIKSKITLEFNPSFNPPSDNETWSEPFGSSCDGLATRSEPFVKIPPRIITRGLLVGYYTHTRARTLEVTFNLNLIAEPKVYFYSIISYKLYFCFQAKAVERRSRLENAVGQQIFMNSTKNLVGK